MDVKFSSIESLYSDKSNIGDISTSSVLTKYFGYSIKAPFLYKSPVILISPWTFNEY